MAVATPALAATKIPAAQLKLIPLAPTVATNFSAGDEVQQVITTSGALLLVGTVETTTSNLITAPSLGSSDGFIVALDARGAHLWDLRLGTVSDDVATAEYVDVAGNIWIAGSTAVSATSPAPGLNQITIWEVSSSGVLENTYSRSVTDIDIPNSISQKGANLVIAGNSSKVGFPTFTLTVSPTGNISAPKNSSVAPATSPGLLTVSSAAYIWQNFVTSQVIKGVVGIPSHQATTVLIDSSLKARTLKSVFSIQGTPLSLKYQSGIGVVALTQGSGTYYLTIVHTK